VQFKKVGIELDIVNNGAEAVEALKQDEYNLILMDMNMPVLNGIEATKVIRNELNDHDVPIIAMTASDLEEDRKLCLESGMNDFLSKPMKIQNSLAVIKKWFKKMEMAKENDQNFENNSIKILNTLLAEDNDVNILLAKKTLTKAGHNVTIVKNGQDAVDAFQKNSFDIFLTDINMPVMDGIEASIQIKKLNSNIPIIAITADSTPKNINECYAAGINDIILKPYVGETLLQCIAKLTQENTQKNDDKQTIEKNDKQIVEKKEDDQDLQIKNAINMDYALSLVEGDKEIYYEILEVFRDDLPSMLEDIKSAINEKDSKKLHITAHTLKSTSVTTGALSLGDLFKTMEKAGKENDIETARSLINDVQKEYEIVMKSINKILV